MKKYLLILALGFLCFIPTRSFAAFQYYSSITVTSTASIASGTNANFPMLVSSTETYWKSSANGGTIHNLTTAPNGEQEAADLVFATSTANCTAGNYLNFETEAYTSSTGALVDWVNVPSVSTGTVIYACYDAPGVTTDQSHPSSTWNSHYLGVWHFSAPTGTLNMVDSTGKNPTSTVTGTVTSTIGMFGAGYYQSSTAANYISVGIIHPSSTSITISAWVKQDTCTNGGGCYILSANFDGNEVAYDLSETDLGAGGGMAFFDGAWRVAGGTLTYQGDGKYHFITGTYNGSQLIWDVDASSTQANTLSYSGSMETNGTTKTSIGAYIEDAAYFGGAIDEVHISNMVESPSWILTEYNNQSAPDAAQFSNGFYAVGAQTAFGGGSNPIVKMIIRIFTFDW